MAADEYVNDFKALSTPQFILYFYIYFSSFMCCWFSGFVKQITSFPLFYIRILFSQKPLSRTDDLFVLMQINLVTYMRI
jgi:hypothetical protein